MGSFLDLTEAGKGLAWPKKKLEVTPWMNFQESRVDSTVECILSEMQL